MNINKLVSQIDELLQYLCSFRDLGATLRSSSFPILFIPAQPIPLFARWAWYELGKQTADTLRYFLTLHQLSFPAAPRQLSVRNCPEIELRLFFSNCRTARWLLRTVPPGATGNVSDQHYFDFIKWGEQTALGRAKRRQLFEQASLQKPSCSSDRRQ